MSRKLTLEEANRKLSKKKIRILNYDGILKPVDAECLICGYKWKTQANVLLNNICGCPKCNHKKAGKKIAFTKESFLKSCGTLKNNITMVGEYKRFQEKTQFHCNDCGYDWETTPYMIKKFKTCPNCTGNRKLTHEEYVDRVQKAHGLAYEVISPYKGLSKKIKIRHHSCGKEFETNALNFIGVGKKPACGCPYCTSLIKSKGEAKIEDYLISKKYYYQRQYRTKECKNKKKLPFDFAIFDNEKKENIIALIEYDGIQHYEYRDKGIFTYEKYLIIQNSDRIKNNFCKDKNIQLLRIPYFKFDDINNILDNFFNKRSTTIESTEKNLEVSRVGQTEPER